MNRRGDQWEAVGGLRGAAAQVAVAGRGCGKQEAVSAPPANQSAGAAQGAGPASPTLNPLSQARPRGRRRVLEERGREGPRRAEERASGRHAGRAARGRRRGRAGGAGPRGGRRGGTEGRERAGARGSAGSGRVAAGQGRAGPAPGGAGGAVGEGRERGGARPVVAPPSPRRSRPPLQGPAAELAMGKGDPNKPRGKMSSYAYFVQTCREEHKKKHPDSSVNFAEFSRKCSERWKVSPVEGRLPSGRGGGGAPSDPAPHASPLPVSADDVQQGERQVRGDGQGRQSSLRQGDEELRSSQRGEEGKEEGPQRS